MLAMLQVFFIALLVVLWVVTLYVAHGLTYPYSTLIEFKDHLREWYSVAAVIFLSSGIGSFAIYQLWPRGDVRDGIRFWFLRNLLSNKHRVLVWLTVEVVVIATLFWFGRWAHGQANNFQTRCEEAWLCLHVNDTAAATRITEGMSESSESRFAYECRELDLLEHGRRLNEYLYYNLRTSSPFAKLQASYNTLRKYCDPRDVFHTRLMDARIAMRDRRFSEALGFITEALALAEGDESRLHTARMFELRARYLSGNHGAGYADEVRLQAQKAPDDRMRGVLLVLLGNCLYGSPDTRNRAVLYYEEAADLLPERTRWRALYNVAWYELRAAMDQSNTIERERMFRRAISRALRTKVDAPHLFQPRVLLGVIYTHWGRYASADREFEKATEEISEEGIAETLGVDESAMTEYGVYAADMRVWSAVVNPRADVDYILDRAVDVEREVSCRRLLPCKTQKENLLARELDDCAWRLHDFDVPQEEEALAVWKAAQALTHDRSYRVYLDQLIEQMDNLS